jgi:hypothetical protein
MVNRISITPSGEKGGAERGEEERGKNTQWDEWTRFRGKVRGLE